MILLVVLFCHSDKIWAQDGLSYRFTNIAMEDGLGDDWCHEAIMDKLGYMWFGTQDGLSLFDGEKFTTFRYLEEDPFSIGGNIIMDLMEGEKGIWIASNGGGLNYFDHETEQFIRFPHDPRDPSTISANTAVCLFEDEEKIIWVGTYDRGFNRFDPKTRRFKRYDLSKKVRQKDAFKFNSVLDIKANKDKPSLLWLATNNGLYSFNKETEELRFLSSPTIAGQHLMCHKIQYSQDGNLLLATSGAGLAKFDVVKETWMVYPSEPHFWEEENIYGNLIFDLEPKSEKEWWVAHKSRGLGIFNTDLGTYQFLKHDPTNPFSVCANEGFGLYKDIENRLWFLSFRQGISFLDPAYQTFQHTLLKSSVCSTTAFNEVKAFAKNPADGYTYVAAHGCDGLYVYNASNQLVDMAPCSIHSKDYQVFTDVLIDSYNKVWVLSANDWGDAALLTYNSETGYCEPFQHPQLEQIPLHSFQLVDILEDHSQNLWLATNFQGLIKIDFQKDTIIQYLQSAAHPNYIDASVEMSEIKLDSKGNIWIASLTDGVSVFNPEKASFRYYESQTGQSNILTDTRVLSIEEDYLGNIWIGTNTHGVQILDPRKQEEPIISTKRRKEGLPAEQISKIRRDSNGNMWIATSKGLSKYSIKEKSFTSFGKNEGIGDIFLINKGMEVGADGSLFLGQNWGFYSFHPDSVFINRTPPGLRLTFFKVFEQERHFGKNLNFLKEVQLKYSENFFSIGFSCLNYSAPEKNRYAYQLEGVDKDWVYPVPGQMVAYYTTVDPGHYTFKVRAANNDGIWNDLGHSLRIYIAPPFWETPWFYMLCAVLLLSTIYAIYIWRLNALNRRAQTEIQLAELELKALRSQMNPHFIFNSLNSIKLLIQAERKNEAGDYLTKFSKMIRGVLHHSDRKRITLSEELEIAKLFLAMEELRFQKKFKYSIEIDESLDADMISVPPLIFQPYLENAIWHGLMHLEEEGMVTLNVLPKGDLIQCIIEDNGIGREMAQQIKSKRRRSKHKSVGMSITQERFRLTRKLNNSSMGVEVIDKKDASGKALGTKVIINLN